MKRVATNCLICTLLFLMVADAVPRLAPFHQRIKDWIDPVLDVTGLWQGEWSLFAPNVVKRNTRVSAQIRCTNGVTLVWSSPSMQTLTIPGRFLAFREGEFYDTLLNDRESGAWGSVADYLARTEVDAALPGEKPVSIRLFQHWWDVPPPGSGGIRPAEQVDEIHHEEYTW